MVACDGARPMDDAQPWPYGAGLFPTPGSDEQPLLLPIAAEPLPDGWLRLEPNGELDIASCVAFEQCLVVALDRSRRVLLDLRKVSFVDSTGLAAIVAVARHARRTGAELEVALPLPAQGRRLFELTGALDRLTLRQPPTGPAAGSGSRT